VNPEQLLAHVKDGDWSLFLDRDGVINTRLPGDYVKRIEEFEFLEDVPKCIAKLANVFKYIVIVTNQQGIGKGLMSESDLALVHGHMRKEVMEMGGRIDAIYHAPYLAQEGHPWRKPGTGMGVQATLDMPDLDLCKSVMVGDSPSDMEFGKKLGMVTVAIDSPHEDALRADLHFDSLKTFTKWIWP